MIFHEVHSLRRVQINATPKHGQYDSRSLNEIHIQDNYMSKNFTLSASGIDLN